MHGICYKICISERITLVHISLLSIRSRSSLTSIQQLKSSSITVAQKNMYKLNELSEKIKI